MQIPQQLSVCHASVISSACMGKCGKATLIMLQLSVCLQHGEETRAHSSGGFCKGMEQPLGVPPISPTREEREPQVCHPYGMPLVDLRHMLEGDVPQDKMTCLFL